MTNLRRIKNMSIDELAEWLDENGMFVHSPWLNLFNEKYCENCETVKFTYEETEKNLDLQSYNFLGGGVECAFCELEDENGIKRCRFFPDKDKVPDNKEMIKMWLNEEAE